MMQEETSEFMDENDSPLFKPYNDNIECIAISGNAGISKEKFLQNKNIINIMEEDSLHNNKDDLLNLMNEEPQSPVVLNKNGVWPTHASNFLGYYPEGSSYEPRGRSLYQRSHHYNYTMPHTQQPQLIPHVRYSSNSTTSEATIPKPIEMPELSKADEMEIEAAETEETTCQNGSRQSSPSAREVSTCLSVSPQKTVSEDNSREIQKIGCNCKKSKCLKLYCECFANGDICTEGCNCENCENLENKKIARHDAMRSILARNPDAFSKKISALDDGKLDTQVHKKGCHCKKSGCKKKYCECWAAGIECSSSCKCEGCKNCEEQRSREKAESESLCKPAAVDNNIGEISTEASSSKSPEREQKKIFHIVKVPSRRRHSGQIEVKALEMKLPSSTASTGKKLGKLRDTLINC